jgi:hypothetical protein
MFLCNVFECIYFIPFLLCYRMFLKLIELVVLIIHYTSNYCCNFLNQDFGQREFSSFSWALYQIAEQEKFFTLLKNFISVTTGIECHMFDNTFHFLLSLKNSMLQLQHIFVMIGVDVNSPSIYHGLI